MTRKKWVTLINTIPHCGVDDVAEMWSDDPGETMIYGDFYINKREEEHLEGTGWISFNQSNQAGFGIGEKTIFSGDWNSVYLELKHYIEKLWVIPEIVPLD